MAKQSKTTKKKTGKKLSDEELIETTQDMYTKINGTIPALIDDIMDFNAMLNKLIKRGYDIQKNGVLQISKKE